MRVGILGAGAEGSGLAALLAAEDDIDSIQIADIDAGALELALGRLRSLETSLVIEGAVIDGTDQKAARDWISGRSLDAVANTSMPGVNLAVMRACLDAGANYMDLNGGPFEVEGLIAAADTIDAQLEFDDRFREAGLTAVSCAGVAPGWVDLAARRAGEHLDSVDSIIVRWIERNDGSRLISTVGPELIAGFNMPSPLRWEGESVAKVDLWDSEESYDWPRLGRVPVYTGFMHPEIRTMQSLGFDPALIEVKSGLSNGRWASSKDIWGEALRQSLDSGVRDLEGGIESVLGQAFIPPDRYEDAISDGVVSEGTFAVCVEVTGERGGEPVRRTQGLMTSLAAARRHIPWGTHMVYATIGSTPIALLPRLGRRSIARSGVFNVGVLDEWEDILDAVSERDHETWEIVKRGVAVKE